jgi:hypothetical protein
MPTSTPRDLPIISGLDTLRALQRLAYWLGYDMREHDEEWAAAIDLLGYCRLAICDVTGVSSPAVDSQEIALASHVVGAYRRIGFQTQRCSGDFIGTQAGDTLYYLPALRQVVRTMYRSAR